MTKKKFGKILLLLQIPFFISFIVLAVIYEKPDRSIPAWLVAFVVSILVMSIVSLFMIEEMTPKSLWKNIIEFINE